MGASMGIGREIAKVLAAEGAQTVVIARRSNLLAVLQGEIEQTGARRPLAITADLYDRSVPAEVCNQVLNTIGYIDILVNNAGGARPLPIDAPDEAWDESFALNFTAVRKMTQAFLPVMQKRGWVIINITGPRPSRVASTPPAPQRRACSHGPRASRETLRNSALPSIASHLGEGGDERRQA